MVNHRTNFLATTSTLTHHHGSSNPRLVCLPRQPFSPSHFMRSIRNYVGRCNEYIITISRNVTNRSNGLVTRRFSRRHSSRNGLRLNNSNTLNSTLTGLLGRGSNNGVGHIHTSAFNCLRHSFPNVTSRTSSGRTHRINGTTIRTTLSNGCRDNAVTVHHGPNGRCRVCCRIMPLHSITGRAHSVPSRFVTPGNRSMARTFVSCTSPVINRLPPINTLWSRLRLMPGGTKQFLGFYCGAFAGAEEGA